MARGSIAALALLATVGFTTAAFNASDATQRCVADQTVPGIFTLIRGGNCSIQDVQGLNAKIVPTCKCALSYVHLLRAALTTCNTSWGMAGHNFATLLQDICGGGSIADSSVASPLDAITDSIRVHNSALALLPRDAVTTGSTPAPSGAVSKQQTMCMFANLFAQIYNMRKLHICTDEEFHSIKMHRAPGCTCATHFVNITKTAVTTCHLPWTAKAEAWSRLVTSNCSSASTSAVGLFIPLDLPIDPTQVYSSMLALIESEPVIPKIEKLQATSLLQTGFLLACGVVTSMFALGVSIGVAGYLRRRPMPLSEALLE